MMYNGPPLQSVSGLESYRQRYGRIAPDRIVQMLLLDRTFPRSAQNCLIATENSLRVISSTPIGTFQNEAEQHLGQLCSELMYTDVSQIFEIGVHEFVIGLQAKINLANNAIFDTFFA